MKTYLSLLVSACVVGLASSASGDARQNGDMWLTLPGLDWGIGIAAPGFVIEEREITEGESGARLEAVNETNGVILSAFLEEAPNQGGARECRDYYWSKAVKSPIKKEQIRLFETGSVAVVEYMVPEIHGVSLNQKNVNVYMAKDGYWVDVHISQAGYRPGMQDHTIELIQKITFTTSCVPSVSDYIAFGNTYFRFEKYVAAAEQYQLALDSEKKARTITRARWLVLVDKLGMAYGITKKYDESISLYRWALESEPEYPYFYYNLACAYGEIGKRVEALENLKLAYKFKANMLPDDTWPDPEKDSSFAGLMGDEEFSSQVKSLKQAAALSGQ